MTHEEIEVYLPVWSSEKLADFIQELRGVQDSCPDNVIPEIKFSVRRGWDGDDPEVECWVSYPRMETQLDAERRARCEAAAKAQRRHTYEKLKTEFETA